MCDLAAARPASLRDATLSAASADQAGCAGTAARPAAPVEPSGITPDFDPTPAGSRLSPPWRVKRGIPPSGRTRLAGPTACPFASPPHDRWAKLIPRRVVRRFPPRLPRSGSGSGGSRLPRRDAAGTAARSPPEKLTGE